MRFTVKQIVIAALIAALYFVITWILKPISFGPVQLRVAEALTALPILTVAAVPGVFVGCLLSNIIGGYGLPDILFGSLATLLAAVMTYALRRRPVIALLPPVIVNALVIGVMLFAIAEAPLLATILYIAAGQALSCYGLGLSLLQGLKRLPSRYSIADGER